MFKKLWHLFAVLVVPLVPVLKGHLIKQHSIDIKAELLLNHTITSGFLGFGWPTALGSSNGEEITKGAWLSKLLGIVYYSMCYHFWSLQLIFKKLHVKKRTCLCQYERISFLYLYISLSIYLFIYSHLFNNTATSDSTLLLKKGFMLTFLKTQSSVWGIRDFQGKCWNLRPHIQSNFSSMSTQHWLFLF